jgi:protocatechuate 3,4-dioxygenase beta subunit
MNRSAFAILTVHLIALLLIQSTAPAGEGIPPVAGEERVVGRPCEGCTDVFIGLPKSLTSRERIAPPDEPGQPLRLDGVVYDGNGKPAGGIIVYAYHTNAKGIYPDDLQAGGGKRSRHGGLRGWVKTDERGRYRFDTIRPAGYPGTQAPQHIHMHVIEPGRCTYSIDDVLFEDDPRHSPEDAKRMSRGKGGSGIVKPEKDPAGSWHVTRDIRLGANVSGYEECSKGSTPAPGR